jgi:hypothetical protein
MAGKNGGQGNAWRYGEKATQVEEVMETFIKQRYRGTGGPFLIIASVPPYLRC